MSGDTKDSRARAAIARRNQQDRPPNFRSEDGDLYLVRCFACGGDHGRENYALAVPTGTCAWCGWSEEPTFTPSPEAELPITVDPETRKRLHLPPSRRLP